MNFRRLTRFLAIAGALTALAIESRALSITDANYLGSVDPNTPASEAHETGFINYLIGMTPGDSDVNVRASDVPVDGNRRYNFVRSINTFTSLPGVAVDDALKSRENPAPGPIDVDGISYILGKYGQVGHVWYVGNLTGNQTLPSSTSNGGLSHYITFRGGEVRVPDGGTTATLLGLAMVSLAVFRRKTH